MNVLVLGSGGREHALAWKIAQSSKCDSLYIAPGNAGTMQCGVNVEIDLNDFRALKNFCLDNRIHLVVVGPEDPLVNGIVDYFKDDIELKYIPIIGPSKAGAQLEGSKDFSKNFMEKYQIPTALYKTFDQSAIQDGLDYIGQQEAPIVLKADGLAAGKGVLICQSVEEAQSEFKKMLDGKFGDASAKVVVEEFLTGIEFSIFILTDGISYKVLPSAKDYKRVGEGDTGLNTGGMGAVSPVPFVDDELLSKVQERIIDPTIEGLKSENIDYRGFLYIGLMNVDGNPYVIEYNVRMGDPETEVVIPRIKTDLLELFDGIARRNLEKVVLEEVSETATTVVLASGGYPESYEKGKKIDGLDVNKGCTIFHAGTKRNNGHIETSGGRVLTVTALGNNIEEALELSNNCADQISFEGKYYRKDIGLDLV